MCAKPFPSMPIFFWNEREGGSKAKYKQTYFSQAGPSLWYQGDFLTIDGSTYGAIIHGRSDGTLNPCGIRFGPSDIYNACTF